jgi:hypothetical protein
MHLLSIISSSFTQITHRNSAEPQEKQAYANDKTLAVE